MFYFHETLFFTYSQNLQLLSEAAYLVSFYLCHSL